MGRHFSVELVDDLPDTIGNFDCVRPRLFDNVHNQSRAVINQGGAVALLNPVGDARNIREIMGRPLRTVMSRFLNSSPMPTSVTAPTVRSSGSSFLQEDPILSLEDPATGKRQSQSFQFLPVTNICTARAN
jgi:hypothetical protein